MAFFRCFGVNGVPSNPCGDDASICTKNYIGTDAATCAAMVTTLTACK
jgi:hypothetical protein